MASTPRSPLCIRSVRVIAACPSWQDSLPVEANGATEPFARVEALHSELLRASVQVLRETLSLVLVLGFGSEFPLSEDFGQSSPWGVRSRDFGGLGELPGPLFPA